MSDEALEADGDDTDDTDGQMDRWVVSWAVGTCCTQHQTSFGAPLPATDIASLSSDMGPVHAPGHQASWALRF